MCGIVGYVGGREALPFLLSGLKRLEYRGYDSAGVAVTGPRGLQVVRRQGKLSVLEGVVASEPPQGTLGIGHTRWATHGRPSELNAHPHTAGAVTVVHNGIIENHLALRAELEKSGRNFTSETDTEIFAHLVDEIRRGKVVVTDRAGTPVSRPRRTIEWNAAQAEKAGYPHFMLKEIFEQPQAVTDTLRGRLSPETGDATLDGIELPIASFKRVALLACGTSYYAALVGKFLIEAAARIPCEVDLASEFRYRDPVVGPGDLVIAISQSGETADTLEAVREAKKKGAQVLAISNVVESSIPRLADFSFYTHAGPEIGVASTKAFTTQLVGI